MNTIQELVFQQINLPVNQLILNVSYLNSLLFIHEVIYHNNITGNSYYMRKFNFYVMYYLYTMIAAICFVFSTSYKMLPKVCTLIRLLFYFITNTKSINMKFALI